MDIKTVDELTPMDEPVEATPVVRDPLLARQREDVAKMRTSLLACVDENGYPTKQAINNITVMRVYHQMTRIIRYLDLMDRLEEKLYDAVDAQIATADIFDDTTLVRLLTIQEKMQKMMLESHKLLQPYLDIEEFTVVDLTASTSTVAATSAVASEIMKPEDRDRLRVNAQTVLAHLQATQAAPGGNA